MSSHPCVRSGRSIVFLCWHSAEDVILKYFSCFKLDLRFGVFFSLYRYCKQKNCPLHLAPWGCFASVFYSSTCLNVLESRLFSSLRPFLWSLKTFMSCWSTPTWYAVRRSHQMDVISIFMKLLKIPPHPEGHFCEVMCFEGHNTGAGTSEHYGEQTWNLYVFLGCFELWGRQCSIFFSRQQT